MTESVSSNPILFSYLTVYTRWILGIVLLIVGVAKTQNVSAFVFTVQEFRVAPRSLSQMLAHLIISVELILGSSLLVGLGVQWTALTAAFLFGGFTVAIFINLVRHNILDCNCFGPYFKEKISPKIVIRNLLFIILCLWVWQFYDGYLALESWLFKKAILQNRPFEPFFLLTVAIVVFGITVLTARTILKNLISRS